MFRYSLPWRKTSEVVVRSNPSSLAYEKRYRMLKKMTLSQSFNTVTEENRFLSLKILLERLSGHVGRRQYKIRTDLTRLLKPLQEQAGLDWHDIKNLSQQDLLDVLGDGLLKLSHSERTVFLTATTARVCGVLRRSNVRHSEQICMNPGHAEHGWRCGQHGHTRDVYFEGKMRANPLLLRTTLERRSSIQRLEDNRGALVEVRAEPDFSVVGRMDDLRNESNPRIWSSPNNATFDVRVIGFEFRVHPEDPRVGPQIQQAHNEWMQHAEVVRHVLWEMIELYAVEKARQPLDIAPGDLGEPDEVNAYTKVFTRRAMKQKQDTTTQVPDASAPIREEDVLMVEQRMSSSSSSADGSSHSRPWFTAPLPQQFENGVPVILPFAPTFIVRGSFKGMDRNVHDDPSAFTESLMKPAMDIRCYAHPDACYWLSPEDEEKAMAHIVNFAKRIPFSLPFNLYLRVDPVASFRGDDGEALRKAMDERQQGKRVWFDLCRFKEVFEEVSIRMRQAEGDRYQGEGEDGTTHSSTHAHHPRCPEGGREEQPAEYEVESNSLFEEEEVSEQSHPDASHPSPSQSRGQRSADRRSSSRRSSNSPHWDAAERLNPKGWE